MKQAVTAILAIFFLAAGSAFAAGNMSVTSGSVEFYGGGAGLLVVSGPDGFAYSQELEAGRASMSLFNGKGQQLVDGTYSWQITLDGQAPAERSGKPTVGETLSGSFTVTGGVVADPSAVEGGFNKDQVFIDDLIVEGSACIGVDCSNGESFGFDTIRLKENNLRIKFEDTSTSASFPGNDWQLLANESDNGGLNKFSIVDTTGNKTPFTVEAGAPTNALYVDDTGNIGVGTNTPASIELYIKDGDSPTLRLEQDGSSGFQSQIWDVAGNETNFFVRDVTNSSTLPFKITPGAPNNLLYLDGGDDRVGINTANPDSLLHVNGGSSATNIQVTGSNVGILLQENDSNSRIIQQRFNSDVFRLLGLDSGFIPVAAGISFDTGTGVVGINCEDAAEVVAGARLVVGDGDGCAGTFTAIVPGSGAVNTSSRTRKENLEAVNGSDVLSKMADIEVYTYDFIEGPKDRLGLMAEDFHQVFGRGSDKMISSQDVQMALWLAVKELSAQNQELTEKLSGLEAQLTQ